MRLSTWLAEIFAHSVRMISCRSAGMESHFAWLMEMIWMVPMWLVLEKYLVTSCRFASTRVEGSASQPSTTPEEMEV